MFCGSNVVATLPSSSCGLVNVNVPETLDVNSTLIWFAVASVVNVKVWLEESETGVEKLCHPSNSKHIPCHH
jgi:hypothetical protein